MQRMKITRRQVLRGTGGVTLGLPFLPSLLPGRAYGADPVFATPKRFVCLGTPHGAVLSPNMHPATTGTTMTLYPGHDIRYAPLSATTANGKTSISPVLTAPSTKLTPALVKKMNVLRGFHIPWYIAHNTGGFLGNFARTDAPSPKLNDRISIDQLLAWSNKFYPSLAGVRQRSMVTGFDFRGMSWGWSNPTAQSGNVDKVGVINNSSRLFDQLFAGSTPVPPPSPSAPKRKPLVDALLASYKSLRESNTRMSKRDVQRLDDHMGQLAELQRKVKSASAVSPLTCSNKKPTDSATLLDDADPYLAQSDCRRRFEVLNDVVAMGLICGASRIASIFSIYPFSDYRGDWHQNVAHQAHTPANQALITDSNQAMFESMVLDLAMKLDAAEEVPDHSVLDSTLLFWGQESGPETHVSQDLTVVTFGGANGFFRTGLYVDYRDLSAKARLNGGPQLGLEYRQWLANCLQAMDIPRGQFETGGVPGYGDPYAEAGYSAAVHPNVISRASELLPVITG